jgi:AhpD family alkylhydroperoxidase
MAHHHDVLTNLAAPTRSLRRELPEVWPDFLALYRDAMTDGAVPARLKEAAALAMSVLVGCDGCIASHARSAARAGATSAEVAELLGVALVMGGGPASIEAPRAWEAYVEFADSAAATHDRPAGAGDGPAGAGDGPAGAGDGPAGAGDGKAGAVG